ncbi:hypothetical protein [Embleya scabrispora]|uniref:hypothetical protein n=1 Tax=Embleya scabrispora TaxID=159449 RepID=UPI00137498E5|nr:hypothetical protein [Embleya scabrispora]
MIRTPLEDPTYTPKHPPVGGRIPAVVERWGPRSQRRWFRRFGRNLATPLASLTAAEYQRHLDIIDAMHVHSLEHAGPCCAGCFLEREETGIPVNDHGCCCQSTRQEV